MEFRAICIEVATVQDPSVRRTFLVYLFEANLFALISAVAYAFGLNVEELTASAETVENDPLKSALGLAESVRFLGVNALIAALRENLSNEEMLTRALQSLSAAVPTATPLATVVNSSTNSEETAASTIQLILPTEKDWILAEEFAIGKKYSLAEYYQSDILKKQLADFRDYWMKDDRNSFETVQKRCSRVLLFFGFLVLVRAVADPLTLDLNACLCIAAIEAFVDWHQKVRQTRLGNLVEFLSSFVAVAKFLLQSQRSSSNLMNPVNATILHQLRDIRNRLQARERMEKKWTARDYADENRWLEWNTFRAAISRFYQEYLEVRDNDEGKCPSEESARLLHDVVLLRLFEAQPSRSAEVRLLQHIEWDDILSSKGKKQSVGQWVQRSKINVISQRPGNDEEESCWTQFLGNFKSIKHHSVDETEFHRDDFPDFVDVLTEYLTGGYRKKLMKRGHQHQFVFMTLSGQEFSSPVFANYLGGLLQRLTGQRVTANLLRSSFVTNLYSSDEGANQALRESAASVMRHSTQMAAAVYDRRNPCAKKKLAQKFLSKKRSADDKNEEKVTVKSNSEQISSSSIAEGDGDQGDSSNHDNDNNKNDEAAAPEKHVPRKRPCIAFASGDAVVIPWRDGKGEGFYFCRVVRVDTAGEEPTLIVMELRLIDYRQNLFKPMLQNIWKISASECFHCIYEFNAANGTYHLQSTQNEIMKLI